MQPVAFSSSSTSSSLWQGSKSENVDDGASCASGWPLAAETIDKTVEVLDRGYPATQTTGRASCDGGAAKLFMEVGAGGSIDEVLCACAHIPSRQQHRKPKFPSSTATPCLPIGDCPGQLYSDVHAQQLAWLAQRGHASFGLAWREVLISLRSLRYIELHAA